MAKVQIESPIHLITSGVAPTAETLPPGHIALGSVNNKFFVFVNYNGVIRRSYIAFSEYSYFYQYGIQHLDNSVKVSTLYQQASTGAYGTSTITIKAATATTAGVMSAADKAKLDSLSTSSGSGGGDGKLQITLRKERIYDQSQLQEWYENIELFGKQNWKRPLIPKEAASWKFYVDGVDDFNTYYLAIFTEKNTIQGYKYFDGTEDKQKRRRRRGIKLIAYGDNDYIPAWIRNYQDNSISGLSPNLENRWIELPGLRICAFNNNAKPRKVEKKYYLCVLNRNIMDGHLGNYKEIVNEFGVEKPAPITLEDSVSNIIEFTVRYSTSIVNGETVWTGNVIF